MGRFQKKPVVIEAVKAKAMLRLDDDQLPAWWRLAMEKRRHEKGAISFSLFPAAEGQPHTMYLQTRLGRLVVEPEDWIVREFDGELSLVKADRFALEYESAGDETVSLHPGFENADDSWIQGPVQCTYCGRGWTAVRPTSVPGGLECPDCGKMGGFPGVKWDGQVPS